MDLMGTGFHIFLPSFSPASAFIFQQFPLLAQFFAFYLRAVVLLTCLQYV